jgi:hypothetical protein
MNVSGFCILDTTTLNININVPIVNGTGTYLFSYKLVIVLYSDSVTSSHLPVLFNYN